MFGLLWRGAPGCVRGGRARGRVMRASVLRRRRRGAVASPGGAGILSDGLWHYSRDASQSKSNSGEKEKQNVPCV